MYWSFHLCFLHKCGGDKCLQHSLWQIDQKHLKGINQCKRITLIMEGLCMFRSSEKKNTPGVEGEGWTKITMLSSWRWSLFFFKISSLSNNRMAVKNSESAPSSQCLSLSKDKTNSFFLLCSLNSWPQNNMGKSVSFVYQVVCLSSLWTERPFLALVQLQQLTSELDWQVSFFCLWSGLSQLSFCGLKDPFPT